MAARHPPPMPNDRWSRTSCSSCSSSPAIGGQTLGTGWTTTAERTTSWTVGPNSSAIRRSLSNAGLQQSSSRTPTNSPDPSLAKNQSHGALLSDRLRGAGAEVVVQGSEGKLMWTDLSHAERGRKRSQAEKLFDTRSDDLHADCRARLEASTNEYAEVVSELHAMQRDHERLLRLMGAEREEFRSVQKAQSESQQLAQALRLEVHSCREELSAEERARLRNESEESSLRAKLIAAQEHNQHLQESLYAEEVAGQAAVDRIQESLTKEEHCVNAAAESRIAASNRELLFAELEAQVAALSDECISQRESLREKSCELDALAMHDAMSSTNEGALRLELSRQRELYASELSTALAEVQASEERNVEHQQSLVRDMSSNLLSERDKLLAERDEAERRVKEMLEHARKTNEGAQKREDKAKSAVKSSEARASAAEKERKDAQAALQKREVEIKEAQERTAASALKNHADLIHARSELEKAKTEIAELYDALLRSENEKKPNKKK